MRFCYCQERLINRNQSVADYSILSTKNVLILSCSLEMIAFYAVRLKKIITICEITMCKPRDDVLNVV